MSTDETFMREALRQAKKAYGKMETPIGCVIVWEGKIIARGYNKRNEKKILLPTQRSVPYIRRVKCWGTGGWRGAPCM